MATDNLPRRQIQIDASLREGDIVTRRDEIKEVLALDSVRRALWGMSVAAIVVLLLAFLYWRSEQAVTARSLNVVSQTIKTTQALFAGKSEVGEGSKIAAVLRAKPFPPGVVTETWMPGDRVDARNDFGGKLDVVAMKTFFALHYNGVPARQCVELGEAFAGQELRLYINTLPFGGPYSEAKLKKACYGEINNMVWHFR